MDGTCRRDRNDRVPPTLVASDDWLIPRIKWHYPCNPDPVADNTAETPGRRLHALLTPLTSWPVALIGLILVAVVATKVVRPPGGVPIRSL